MAGYGKWLGGGLGWAFAGPIGALIGFAIGSIIDAAATKSAPTAKKTFYQTTEGDFKASLLVLVASVMKADGSVKKSELNVVKRFLVANFGEEAALDALQILKKLLEKEIDITQVTLQINQYMNYPIKLEILHLLLKIAYADAEVSSSEMNVIQRIAYLLKISSSDFESLKAIYVKHEDHQWAYKALEIESTASNEEIKKAYREMAKKYHPDKVNTLGEDIKKLATEKFRSINEAYETLKKERGFV